MTAHFLGLLIYNRVIPVKIIIKTKGINFTRNRLFSLDLHVVSGSFLLSLETVTAIDIKGFLMKPIIKKELADKI